MPFIELPQTPNTGLAQFGQALSSGAHDYMESRLADQRIAQQQQNQLALEAAAQKNRLQLADVDTTNRIAGGIADTNNRIQIMNATNAADIRKGAIELLVTHGYLTSIDDANDPDKFRDALLASQRDGLYQRYQALLSTPDPATGKPLLSPSEMTDPSKVNAAMDKMATFQTGQTSIGLSNARDAKDAATAAQLRLQQVHQQGIELNSKLVALEAQSQPTQQEVQAKALSLAQAATPGKVPSDAQVQAQMDAARQQVVQDKMQQIQAIRAPLDEQRRIQGEDERAAAAVVADYARKGIYPESSQLTEPDDGGAPTAAAPAALDPRAVGAQALGALVPRSAPGAAPGLLADPTGNDPIIAGENQRRQQAAFQNNVTTPTMQAQQELASIDQQLQAAHTPAAPNISSFSSPQFGLTTPAPSLSDQAQQISSLLQRKAAVQARLAQLQGLAAQQPGIPGGVPTLAGQPGLTPGLGMPQTGAQLSSPMLSDINGSTPAGNAGAPSMADLYGGGQSYLNQ